MTVELERPFVWPAEPEDLGPWGKGDVDAQKADEEAEQERRGQVADTVVNKERRVRMREQARSLLEGKSRWKPKTGRSLGGMLTK